RARRGQRFCEAEGRRLSDDVGQGILPRPKGGVRRPANDADKPALSRRQPEGLWWQGRRSAATDTRPVMAMTSFCQK
ncbi:MAG: hypothetical protein IIZ90_07125, partial [Bacteroidales bacterium]|nr:hypothetical protein [Bacteroidales bacterium]